MISVQEVIIHLQKKIGEYRYSQKRVIQTKKKLRSGKQILAFANNKVRDSMLDEVKNYKNMMEESIFKINDYFQSQIQRQKRCYERELYELRQQIQRQYKVISSMREEVEDLQELIIMQNAKNETGKQSSQILEQVPQEQRKPEIQKLKTVYQLDVIQEETERTVMSSVKSFHEESRLTNQNFIKIQQKENESYSQSDCISNKKKSLINVKEPHQVQSMCENSQFSKHQEESSISEQQSHQKSIYKLEQVMCSSNTSKRQNTFQFDENSEETFQKFESLPLIVNGYITKQFCAKEFNKQKAKDDANSEGLQLREITNSINQSYSEEDRQYKTKMFLEEFRKTFNRCLSSASISRKSSAKTEKEKERFQKSRSREEKKKSSKQKVKTASKPENQKGDSQRLLNDMLKDSYNNSKTIWLQNR